MKHFNNSMKWSEEYLLNKPGVKNAPDNAGIYEILQNKPYSRYKGVTRIVKIGMSESLKNEIQNHLGRHTASNRIKRISKIEKITFRFLLAGAEQSEQIEKQLLKEFEDEHWDLPVCNSTRGYIRNEDSHYAI